MSRRIEVELTSDRGDGTLTWRAAGAKEPKGVLPASLLPAGVAVGDKVKVDADYDMEGVTIVAVLPPTAKKKDDSVIEFLGAPPPPPRDYSKEAERRDRKPRKGDRRPRGDRGEGRERRPQGERPERRRFDRPEKPKLPPKPKAPRLKAGRAHRQALLAELPEEQRPVAEQVLKGGIPAVRAAIDEQNAAAKAAGNPPVKADALLALAETIVPKARVAEWLDRAEAAIDQIDTVDLRDLRSVVTKAESAAKDETSRELADKLRTGLATRLEKEQAAWLAEIAELLADDRVVRALNVSSRPPKAGTPLPPDLAERLATAAGAALTDQIGAKRWSTVLEALALSPVHNKVEPASIPASPNEELVAAVTKVSMQVPQIAAKFGIEPKAPPRDRGRRSRPPRSGGAPPPAAGEKRAPRIPPPPPLEQITGVPADEVPGAPTPDPALPAEAMQGGETPPEAALPPVTGVPADAEGPTTDAPATEEPVAVTEAPAVDETLAAEAPAGEATEAPAAEAPAAEAEPAAVEAPAAEAEPEATEAPAAEPEPTEPTEAAAAEPEPTAAPVTEAPAAEAPGAESEPEAIEAPAAEADAPADVEEAAVEAAIEADVPAPITEDGTALDAVEVPATDEAPPAG